MAEDYNPQIGANLNEIDAAVRRLDAAADRMTAASRAAQRQGYQPSRQEIEREAARARQQEVAYNRPLTQAQQTRLEAEVEAGRAAQQSADAARRRARADEDSARTAERTAADQRTAARTRVRQSSGQANPAAQRFMEAEQRAETLYWAERARKVLADRDAANNLQAWERTALQRQLAQAPDVNPRAVKDAQAEARALRAEAGMRGGRPTIGQASAGYGPGRQGRRNVESSGDTLAKKLEKAARESDRFGATMYGAQQRLFGAANQLVDSQVRAAKVTDAATAAQAKATQDARRYLPVPYRPGGMTPAAPYTGQIGGTRYYQGPPYTPPPVPQGALPSRGGRLSLEQITGTLDDPTGRRRISGISGLLTSSANARRRIYIDQNGNTVENIHTGLPSGQPPIAGLLGEGTSDRRHFYVDRSGNVAERMTDIPAAPRRFVAPAAGSGGAHGTYQQGFGPLGPPPSSPPTSVGGPGDGDTTRQQRMGRAVDTTATALQRQTAYVNANSRALRQHGALTTEFIEAAARGETSYREWGYQIGATAAKFAGWTAVSIPVFAALDGVRLIGKGALESADGVNQLQRVMDNVDAGQAQRSFRQLSSEFNVAPGDAARAMYLAGQRFHDFADATDAARAALFAFKTGELPVDEAMQHLNATASAFGLSGHDLLTIFNQVNEAQNSFGARIPDLITGLSRAGGAFRNAGGDVNSLIVLLSAARIAAGRTGQQAATAIQRSVGYYRRPSNQEALRGFGINPNQSFYRAQGSSVLGDAVDVTRRLVSQGNRDGVRQLATALSSPEFASMFEPILLQAASGNDRLLDRLVKGLDPNSARVQTSASRELHTLLGSPLEQLRGLGNELQRFGSNIASSGLLTVLTGTVGGLRHLAAATNTVGNIFGALPESVRAMTVAFAVARGGLLLARRGSAFEGQTGAVARFFQRSPEAQASVATRQALRQQSDYLTQEAQGHAVRARTAIVRAHLAEQSFGNIRQRPGEDDTAFLDRQKAAANYVVETRDAARSMEQHREALDGMVRDQHTLQEQYKRAARDGKVVQFAQANSIYVNPVQSRPSTPHEPGLLGDNTRQASIFTGVGLAQQRMQRVLDSHGPGPTTGRDVTAYLKAAEAAQYRSFGALRGGAGEVAKELGGAARAAGGSVRRFGSMIGDAIGPFGAFVLALEAGVAIFQWRMGQIKKADDRAGSWGDTPTSSTDRDRKYQDALKYVRDRDAKYRRSGDTILSGNGRPLSQEDIHTDLSSTDRNYSAALSAVRTYRAEQATRQKQRERGLPQTGLTRQDIEQQFHDVEAQFNVGAITVDERAKQIDLLVKGIDRGYFGVGKKAEQVANFLKNRLRSAQRQEMDPGSITDQLFRDVDTLDTGTLGKEVESLAKLAQAGGAKSKDLRRYFATQVALLAQAATDRSPTGRAAYAEQVQQTVDTMDGFAQNELQRSLGVATTQRERDKAYEEYFSTTDQADNRLQQDLRGTRRRRQAASKALGALKQQPHGGTLEEQKAVDDRRKQLEAEVAAAGSDARRISKALSDFRKWMGPRVRAQLQAQFQSDQADQRSITDLHALNFSEGYQRAQYLLRRAGLGLHDAIKAFGRHSQEVRAILQAQKEAEDQVAQERLARFDAATGLAIANAGINDNARRNVERDRLQQRLGMLRQNPRTNPNEITQTLTQLRELENDALRQAQQEATDLLRAQFAYRMSLTDDQSKTADLQSQLADAIVRRGGFESKADELNARAEANNARRQKYLAHYQEREETINYYADIGRYDKATQVAALRGLLSDIEGNKKLRGQLKDYKRQLRREIHQLEEGAASDYNLDVGNIRLPTPYEVFRAIKEGDRARNTAAVRAAVRNDNTININVMDREDVGLVADALDQVLQSSANSAMRAMGVFN